jgi:hypothetical protein
MHDSPVDLYDLQECTPMQYKGRFRLTINDVTFTVFEDIKKGYVNETMKSYWALSVNKVGSESVDFYRFSMDTKQVSAVKASLYDKHEVQWYKITLIGDKSREFYFNIDMDLNPVQLHPAKERFDFRLTHAQYDDIKEWCGYKFGPLPYARGGAFYGQQRR